MVGEPKVEYRVNQFIEQNNFESDQVFQFFFLIRKFAKVINSLFLGYMILMGIGIMTDMNKARKLFT